MSDEQQDPQNRKDAMHTLNEWLGQEHAIGYQKGYQEGCKDKGNTMNVWREAQKLFFEFKHDPDHMTLSYVVNECYCPVCKYLRKNKKVLRKK